MRILIGYSMRSGSTLLQHILDGHSGIRAYGDLSSIPALWRCWVGDPQGRNLCIKPMDLLYMQRRLDFYRHFDKFVWIARDPRDSYLSTIESGYAYLLWRKGPMQAGIDLGLLERWRRVYRQYFDNAERWHLVRYEDLVAEPVATVRGILRYLDLPYERLFPFPRFKRHHGGDYKIARHDTVTTRSMARYLRELSAEQTALFEERLGGEMRALGYGPAGEQEHGLPRRKAAGAG